MKSFLTIAAILLLSTSIAEASCDHESQVEALALNMYHEARGEGSDAMQMVGETTLNRVAHPQYPNDICSVVYQRRQFSWTHTIQDTTPRETDAWEVSVDIAERLLSGDIDLFDNGATHFLNPNTVRVMPSWTRTFTQVGRIGNHIFYEKPYG